VKAVELKVRIIDSRQAFHSSTTTAWLELPNGTSAGMTRGHASWADAASAALAMARRRGLRVSNETPVLARIEADHRADEQTRDKEG